MHKETPLSFFLFVNVCLTSDSVFVFFWLLIAPLKLSVFLALARLSSCRPLCILQPLLTTILFNNLHLSLYFMYYHSNRYMTYLLHLILHISILHYDLCYWMKRIIIIALRGYPPALTERVLCFSADAFHCGIFSIPFPFFAANRLD